MLDNNIGDQITLFLNGHDCPFTLAEKSADALVWRGESTVKDLPAFAVPYVVRHRTKATKITAEIGLLNNVQRQWVALDDRAVVAEFFTAEIERAYFTKFLNHMVNNFDRDLSHVPLQAWPVGAVLAMNIPFAVGDTQTSKLVVVQNDDTIIFAAADPHERPETDKPHFWVEHDKNAFGCSFAFDSADAPLVQIAHQEFSAFLEEKCRRGTHAHALSFDAPLLPAAKTPVRPDGHAFGVWI